MTTFYLIRHGEKDTIAEMLTGQMPGVHLTPAGKVHANRIARHLAREPIEQIFSSPLGRAMETAEPLARDKRVEIQSGVDFGEIDFGAWSGKTFRQLEGDPAWRAFNQFRSGARIPGGESIVGVQARFVGELLRLHAQFPEQGIAVVSHADPIKLAIGYFLGMPIDFFERLEISVGSISVLMLAPWGARLLRLNEVPSAGPDECTP